jgi:nuclear mRNA export protein PCID2/THP1
MVDRNAKVTELRNALNAFDLDQIAGIFQLPPLATQKRALPPADNVSLTDHGLDWSSTLTYHCNAVDAALCGDALAMCEAQLNMHATFHTVFGSSNGNWLVPTLHMICRMTHQAAVLADKESAANNTSNSKDSNANLQKAVTVLQESYSKTSNDRKEFKPDAPLDDEEGSKKAGVLAIVNELFAIYFKLNTLRLCKNLLRPVESRKLHEQGKMSEMVTYRFYVGRLFLFEDQYQAAEENLDYALQHCHKDALSNKQKILRYLVPVKLYRGRLPSPKLLQKYSLTEFLPIVQGVRTGDLRMFHDGLVKYQDVFIQ